MKKVLVLGAAGFIGQALEYRLREEGHFVVSVARKLPPFRKSVASEFNILDLTNTSDFHSHFWRHSFDEVYQCAGVVGGLGYIGDSAHDAEILTDSLKINLYTLEAIRKCGGVGRIFFTSSQCVYPDNRFSVDPFAAERIAPPPAPWKETDAAFENNFAFAKEKMYTEVLYAGYARNYGMPVRIGRLGNTYGPFSVWAGDRAKVVASICRKVAQAPYAGVVELWGDGQASRSFTYVDDAVEGILRLMRSDAQGPVNIAHPDTVTIAELFETICEVAGKVLAWKPSAGPEGVKHRGSDNTLCKQLLNWEPSTSLRAGLEKTYPWVKEQALTKASA
jgi:nucleoside-diphosphate-sugar epimerase